MRVTNLLCRVGQGYHSLNFHAQRPTNPLRCREAKTLWSTRLQIPRILQQIIDVILQLDQLLPPLLLSALQLVPYSHRNKGDMFFSNAAMSAFRTGWQ